VIEIIHPDFPVLPFPVSGLPTGRRSSGKYIFPDASEGDHF
jgi:hypothetical protein